MRNIYFLVVVVGVAAAIADIAANSNIYIAFIIFYTIVYTYFVVQYINYVAQFQTIELVVSNLRDSEVQNGTADITSRRTYRSPLESVLRLTKTACSINLRPALFFGWIIF